MMIIDQQNSTAKHYNVEARETSKSLVIPTTSGAPVGSGKNLQSNVANGTSDPALIKNDVATASSQIPGSSDASPPSNPCKKSVRFDEVTFRKTIPVEDGVDPSEIWYSKQEFSKTALHIQGIIQQVKKEEQKLQQSGIKMQRQNGAPPHPELRGVEDLAWPQNLRCRKMRMNQVIKGVLQEQKRQQSQGMSNPLLLSVRCREFSTIAQQLAIQRARWDAQEATAAAAC